MAKQNNKNAAPPADPILPKAPAEPLRGDFKPAPVPGANDAFLRDIEALKAAAPAPTPPAPKAQLLGIDREALQLGTYEVLASLGREVGNLGNAGKDFAFEIGNLVQQANARHAAGELSDVGLRKVLESYRQALESKAAQLAPDLKDGALRWVKDVFGAVLKLAGVK